MNITDEEHGNSCVALEEAPYLYIISRTLFDNVNFPIRRQMILGLRIPEFESSRSKSSVVTLRKGTKQGCGVDFNSL